MSQPILLLGHGYIAHALAKEAENRGIQIVGNVIPGRNLNFTILRAMIQDHNPKLVINAAAFIPTPSVDACKDHPMENIQGNVMLPAAIAHACREQDVPLMQISTGCLFDEQREYTEEDTPTRGWNGYCGAYVGAKLMAEKAVLENPESYVLRIRLPFDEVDSPRNYLSKIAGYIGVWDQTNSLTHRGDFAAAAIYLWRIGAPFGVYHMTNPGHVSTRQVLMAMRSAGIIDRCPEIVEAHENRGGKLSTDKLRKAGVIMRPVEEAVRESINNWRK